jgi:hypothetical protein
MILPFQRRTTMYGEQMVRMSRTVDFLSAPREKRRSSTVYGGA